MIKAVIFDMDGVLIDSEPLWRESEIDAFGRAGLRLTEAMCRETTGLRIDEAVDHWYRRYGWEGPTPGEMAESVVRGLIERVRRGRCSGILMCDRHLFTCWSIGFG